jgi:hypothetical protein
MCLDYLSKAKIDSIFPFFEFKMNGIESELILLRQKIEVLEGQKRVQLEKDTEQKENPLRVLEDIINTKKEKIKRNSYSKSIPLAQFYDQEKVAMLEAIYTILKSIHERLEALEQKA